MSRMTYKIYLLGTYFMSAINIAWSFERIKSVIIFVATIILLFIQIKLHYKRLKKEEEEEEKGKKN